MLPVILSRFDAFAHFPGKGQDNSTLKQVMVTALKILTYHSFLSSQPVQ
jgi:hypothetical protein